MNRVHKKPSPGVTPGSSGAELLRLLDLERQAGTVEAFDQAKISELVRRAGPLSESSGAFRKELHRLFDLADEADRAGDVAGLNLALSVIARLLDGVEGARAPPSAIVGRSKMPWAGQRDLPNVSTQPRASNAK